MANPFRSSLKCSAHLSSCSSVGVNVFPYLASLTSTVVILQRALSIIFQTSVMFPYAAAAIAYLVRLPYAPPISLYTLLTSSWALGNSFRASALLALILQLFNMTSFLLSVSYVEFLLSSRLYVGFSPWQQSPRMCHSTSSRLKLARSFEIPTFNCERKSTL